MSHLEAPQLSVTHPGAFGVDECCSDWQLFGNSIICLQVFVRGLCLVYGIEFVYVFVCFSVCVVARACVRTCACVCVFQDV